MLAGWMNRHQQMAIEYLMEENKVLKELRGDKRLNFTNEQRKRLARKGRKLGLNGLRKVATLVTPETILAWHRKLVALQNLGVKRTKTTIANILQKEGIKPTPERHHLDWNGFLKSHWEVLCATDFFTTEVWTWKGLVRYRPGEPLMNIYAERFVKSIKHECVDRLIFVGEASLRKAVNEYAIHYNEERNHQGIENKIINPRPGTVIPVGDPQAVEHHAEIVRTGRLGDMLNFYQKKAA